MSHKRIYDWSSLDANRSILSNGQFVSPLSNHKYWPSLTDEHLSLFANFTNNKIQGSNNILMLESPVPKKRCLDKHLNELVESSSLNWCNILPPVWCYLFPGKLSIFSIPKNYWFCFVIWISTQSIKTIFDGQEDVKCCLKISIGLNMFNWNPLFWD